MYNIIQDRINKFALRNVLINKLRCVKTVARLLVGGRKCRRIKCPGLTVTTRSIARRKVAIPFHQSSFKLQSIASLIHNFFHIM